MRIELEPVDRFKKMYRDTFNVLIENGGMELAGPAVSNPALLAQLNIPPNPDRWTYGQWHAIWMTAITAMDIQGMDPLGDNGMPLLLQMYARSSLEDGPGEFACGAALADGCPPFLFRDQALVDAILESRLEEVPIHELRLPYNSLCIQMPTDMPVPDGSGDKYRVLVVERANTYLIDKDPNKPVAGHMFYFSYVGTTMAVKEPRPYATHCNLPLKQGGELWVSTGSVGMMASLSDLVLPAVKLLLFLTSPSTVVEKLTRDHKALKKSSSTKAAFTELRVVKFDKTRVEYQRDEEAGASGRSINVRHRVIGHFKHFRKGVLAGRTLWCPPHWRGPEIGEQVQKVYEVTTKGA
jgi:hypothetical protein